MKFLDNLYEKKGDEYVKSRTSSPRRFNPPSPKYPKRGKPSNSPNITGGKRYQKNKTTKNSEKKSGKIYQKSKTTTK